MSRPASRFAFASVMIIIAAVGTTARAGQNDNTAGSDQIWFPGYDGLDGSCRGLISSPLGVVSGIVQVEPGGQKAWATFPSSQGIALAVADLQGAGPYQGRLVGVLPVSGAFKPESLRAGIMREMNEPV